MKKREKTTLMLMLFIMLIGIISSSGMFKTDVSEALPTNNYETLNSLKSSNLKTPENEPPWWNLTYHYRKPITLTEPGYLDRINEPVEVEVNFDSEKAHKNSLRLLYYDEKKNKWIGPLPIQLSETTFDPNDENHIKSTKITFLANVSKGKTETYYLYYTDYSVEEKTYPTDIYANESMISNSYLTWWIYPPKELKYITDTDWNTEDNGWIGFYRWYGAFLNESEVKLLDSKIMENGPIYAKIRHKYQVDYYYYYSPRTNFYTIYFTIYANSSLVEVDFYVDELSYKDRGFWGTVMDVEGDRGDDYYAFYESNIQARPLYSSRTDSRDEADLKDICGWTWAVLFDITYGVGVISHKDYTDNDHPFIVSRDVEDVDYTFIFTYINNPSYYGKYYYLFFKVPPQEQGSPWTPVNKTTVSIAYPLSENAVVGSEEEAYYSLRVKVEDRVGRVVENARVIICNESDLNIVFNESFTSSSGEAVIRFYCNTSLSANIRVNYTTDAGIYVENNSVSVNLDVDSVHVDIPLTVVLNLVDLYVTVQSLDGKKLANVNVKISNTSYVTPPLSGTTNSSGVVCFQRVLGGVSWLINASYVANVTTSRFYVKNDTIHVFTSQSINSFVVSLPVSDLHITAVDMLNRTVNEYTVFLYYDNNLLDQKTTDNGAVVFSELPAENFTLKFKCLSKQEYGNELSPTVVNVWYPSNRNIIVPLPLAYMYVVVVDVNNESIPDADVIIKGDYTYYGVSDESGMVNFTRILYNTVWDIQVSFVTFGGKGDLISVPKKNIWLNDSEIYVFVELPVTDMVIHVLTTQQYNMTEYWKYGVGGAVVYANITGKMDLVSNATDSKGYAIAKFVPVGRYNVTVHFLGQVWSEVFDVYNNSALHFVLPFKYAQVTTRLSVTSPSSPYVDVIWTENITVELTFYVVETNTFIAYGWVNWSLVDMQGNTVLSGFGSYNEEHEVYIVSFNSSEVPAGQYTLKIYGGKTSYPPPSTEVVVVVEVSKVPTELILEKERIRVPVGSDYVSIRVFYKDVFHNASIVNASVILTLENQSYQMIPDEENPGWYVYDLPVSNLSMGVYEVKVYAEKTNYKPVEESISLQITEKVIKIGTFSIPRTIFFASIIGIGVPVAGIAGFYTYRYFRVPKVLRTLNKIISKVEKGERIPLDAVANVRSRRDIVSEKVNKLWRNLGIKFGDVREEGKESG